MLHDVVPAVVLNSCNFFNRKLYDWLAYMQHINRLWHELPMANWCRPSTPSWTDHAPKIIEIGDVPTQYPHYNIWHFLPINMDSSSIPFSTIYVQAKHQRDMIELSSTWHIRLIVWSVNKGCILSNSKSLRLCIPSGQVSHNPFSPKAIVSKLIGHNCLHTLRMLFSFLRSIFLVTVVLYTKDISVKD